MGSLLQGCAVPQLLTTDAAVPRHVISVWTLEDWQVSAHALLHVSWCVVLPFSFLFGFGDLVMLLVCYYTSLADAPCLRHMLINVRPISLLLLQVARAEADVGLQEQNKEWGLGSVSALE